MKRFKMKGLIGLVAILSMVLILNGCQTKKGDGTVLESDLFKTMETVDLKGERVDSSVFEENKLTVVNAWNQGCTPCIEELPILDKLNKEYEGKGISIKGLYYGFEEGISDESREEVNKILSEGNVEYQQLLTSKKMLESETLTNLLAFPATYFVNDKGEIIDFIEGSSDYDGWKARIEKVLKGVN